MKRNQFIQRSLAGLISLSLVPKWMEGSSLKKEVKAASRKLGVKCRPAISPSVWEQEFEGKTFQEWCEVLSRNSDKLTMLIPARSAYIQKNGSYFIHHWSHHRSQLLVKIDSEGKEEQLNYPLKFGHGAIEEVNVYTLKAGDSVIVTSGFLMVLPFKV